MLDAVHATVMGNSAEYTFPARIKSMCQKSTDLEIDVDGRFEAYASTDSKRKCGREAAE